MSERQWFSDKCKTRHALRILSQSQSQSVNSWRSPRLKTITTTRTTFETINTQSAARYYCWRYAFISSLEIPCTSTVTHVWSDECSHSPQPQPSTPLARSHWTHARPPAPPTCQLLHWSFEISKPRTAMPMRFLVPENSRSPWPSTHLFFLF